MISQVKQTYWSYFKAQYLCKCTLMEHETLGILHIHGWRWQPDKVHSILLTPPGYNITYDISEHYEKVCAASSFIEAMAIVRKYL